MRCYDFKYDGRTLSDFGFIICKFNGGGMDTVSNGAPITFNTVSTLGGDKWELTSSMYEECLEATFQICKNFCDGEEEEITFDEIRHIMRWLNRKGFHKFKLLEEGYVDVYYEASFNVSKIEFDGKVIGFELDMITNRPFALLEPVCISFENTEDDIEEGKVWSLSSMSDDEGYIYPEMTIVCNADGDLSMYNEAEDRDMVINNCSFGETITLNYPIIESSLGDDRKTKIQDDFNWVFYRLANKFMDSRNKTTISLPCSVEIIYCPIVKVGI